MREINARTLTEAQRRQILERDEYLCGYCGAEAVCVDHIVPWSHMQDNHPENLIAACWLCNGIAGNKIFETVSEKRSHVLKRVEQLLQRKKIAIWLESELSDLGYTLKDKIRSTSVVVDSEKDRDAVRAHIEKLGLLTV